VWQQQPMLCMVGVCSGVGVAAIQLAAAEIGDKQKNIGTTIIYDCLYLVVSPSSLSL